MSARLISQIAQNRSASAMAKERPALSKAELEVARIVWERGETTVREVHEALPKGRDIDFWTVQTFLRRLKDKGYLKARRVGHGNVYSPAVQPKRVIRELTDDFVERVFGGEALPLVHQLIDARKLSEQDIEQLQQRLDELRGSAREVQDE